jgi:transcriptional regulator with XRE-family HTH domain
MEEPEPVMPAATSTSQETPAEVECGLQVARAVRDARRGRNLSQRQLAGRMQVPRTYISKIENGKAMPTLSSLERLATALEVDMCNLLHDARNRQHDDPNSVFSDPFLSEIAPLISKLDALQRSMFLNQVRDMAMGRRRTAVA